MAKGFKKRALYHSTLGRPQKGCLSSFPDQIVKLIKNLREAKPGWGAISIHTELMEEYNYSLDQIPQIAAINRYLKEQGYVKAYQPSGEQPISKKCNKLARSPHDLWEMDAKGSLKVKGIGYQVLINIKDIKSRLYCMTFPVSVANSMTQPSTQHYYWALRFAFLQWGLPKRIQVDKDSVFYENKSKSPFPKLFHLWLVGLGIDLCFITQPPPYKNAVVERSHQTLDRQVVKGQSYQDWKQFFLFCNKRRKILNEKLPSKSLGKKAPLQRKHY